MPPLARHRAAATAVAALFVAAPLLATGAVYAAPAPSPVVSVPESGEEVVFSGGRGLLGVSCEANPSASAVTVPAETTLRVVNRTGYRAKLYLDGASQGEIENGGVAPVVFHRGPVTLGLKPSCMLGKQSAVRVEVVAASGSATPGSGTKPGASRPERPPSNEGDRPRTRASASPAPDASPSADASPDAAVTSENGGNLDEGVATVDETTGAEGAAAEALASVEPVRETGPIGLLALIATVCVVGVSAGAIRAIIAQRATRTGVA
ncbi:hypothetical protein [Micromonospora sp. CPCC 206061]|uniref:hypothetical protein n=1 Tax=Micromonospora sp. CPCC 206061 TaxID=3122410 RepID=UPI002FF3E8B2